MPLAGKVALITGATGAIGRPIIDAFLAAGARLALCLRDGDAPEFSDLPDCVHKFCCDLRLEEDVVRTVYRVARRFGRIDIVINAGAAPGPAVPLVDLPIEPWRNVLATSLTGTYLICREVLPWMTRQGDGCIINVSIEPPRRHRFSRGAQLVVTRGLEGLTRQFAGEVRDAGVRVNLVRIDPAAAQSPGNRGAAWTDAFVWLASGDAARTTGQCLWASELPRGAAAEPRPQAKVH